MPSSANGILRIAGQGEPGPHHEHHYSREELKLILHSSRGHDPSDQGMRVLASAVEMGELEVVDWANSREDMISLDAKAPLKEILSMFRRHKFSRYPVYDAEKGVTNIYKTDFICIHPNIISLELRKIA